MWFELVDEKVGGKLSRTCGFESNNQWYRADLLMIFSGIRHESLQGQNLMVSLRAQVTECSAVFV